MTQPTANNNAEEAFTKIPHDLFEAIIRFPFNKRELKVVLAVIRKTYGWHKSADELSLSQLTRLTCIDRSHLSITVRGLIEARVLLKQPGKHAQSLGIQPNFGLWRVLPKQQQGCQNGNSGVAELATGPLPKQQPQKKTPKETTKRNKELPAKDEVPLKVGSTTKGGGSSANKFTDDDLKTAKEVFNLILRLNPKYREPNLNKWADTVRLMRKQDGLTHEEIRELFAWANNHKFWKTNILSPWKLRKQWDRLMTEKLNNPKRGSANERFADRRYEGTADADLPEWAR